MSALELHACLEAVASGRARDFVWLDGGPSSPGWMATDADRVIESDSLGELARLDAAWRAEPDKVWIGWIDYDLGVDQLLGRAPRAASRPGFCARRYPTAQRLAAGEGVGIEAASKDWPLGPLRAELSPVDYRERVARAIEFIRAGETYQINLSQPFFAKLRASGALSAAALELYLQMRAATPASMGALIQASPSSWLVSNSPETLFDVRGEGGSLRDAARVSSWPIKGTRPRHADPTADRAAQDELLASEKDRAEHIMIVDLVRNDLGRIAQTGSVQLAEGPHLTSLPTVHHLVSEVRARLAPGWSLHQVVASLFPGGSITGAPKHRTCELIEQLEGERRGIYCGAIFVLDGTGARFSIPIRTGELGPAGLRLRSGGGVVVDSDPEAERLETLAKARAFDPQSAPA